MAATKFCLIVLTLLVPVILGQCNLENAKQFFKRSVYEFSIDLTKRIAQEKDNHFIASTLSPWSLLATLSLGAKDETYEAIRRALRLHQQPCFNKKVFTMLKDLTTVDDQVTLERSAAIFIDDVLPVKSSFLYNIRNTGVTEVETLRFDDFSAVAQEINNYVSNATHGTIEEVVAAEDLSLVHLILIDALYFKGAWATKFSEADTEVSAFYDSDGVSQLGDVNMMFVTAEANITTIDIINSEVLELPYANERFSMLIFLPDTSTTISDLIENLNMISLTSILNILDDKGRSTVQIQLPKFQMSSNLDNLKELLSDMDLSPIFASDAQFKDISEYSLYVSDIVQKANIEVTEEGTEANAATSAFFSFRMAPASFNANKPFLFMIVDRQTQFTIFTGAYSRPTVY